MSEDENEIKNAQRRALDGFCTWAATLSVEDFRVLLTTLRLIQDAHIPDAIKA